MNKKKFLFNLGRRRAGEGALQAGPGISDKVLDHHASKELQEAKKTHPILTPRQVIRELDQTIIGQKRAKLAVAVAFWKQQRRTSVLRT